MAKVIRALKCKIENSTIDDATLHSRRVKENNRRTVRDEARINSKHTNIKALKKATYEEREGQAVREKVKPLPSYVMAGLTPTEKKRLMRRPEELKKLIEAKQLS